MSTCVVCTATLYADRVFMCPHHTNGDAEWHVGNRVMCDFFHRAKLPARPALESRDPIELESAEA